MCVPVVPGRMEALEETEEVGQTPEDANSLNISDFLDDLEEDITVEEASVPSDVP